MKLNTSVQRVHTNPASDSKQDEVERLRKEVQELKSMFTAMSTLPSQVVADSKGPVSLTKMPTPETSSDSEVAVLRKQVKNLQKQMTGHKLKVSESPTLVLRVEPSRQALSDNRKQTSNDSDGNF